VKGGTIDLAPAALLAQREGFETTLRTAMAELLVVAHLDRSPGMGEGGRGTILFEI
jgi:hypothetical protein